MSDVINSQQGLGSEEINVRNILVQIPESLVLKVSINKQSLSTDEVILLRRTHKAARCNVPQIYSGISAIGELLALSVDQISKESIHAIGWHLNLMGELAFHLHHISEGCHSLLKENQQLQSQKTNP